MPAQPTAATPPGDDLQRLITEAREDLARRLSVAVEQIEVLEATAVVWPDAGVGCPEPGMRYRQVPVDGARIRLRTEGREYEYHSGGRRGLFLCERPPGARRGRPPRSDAPPAPPRG
jgi:hypothetical protein